jgi:hypothetical protein
MTKLLSFVLSALSGACFVSGVYVISR